MSDFIKDAVRMQDNYQDLIESKKLTKKAMCDCCVPFRDKYHLKDSQVLRIARQEVSLHDLMEMEESFLAE